jgi:hypothetical protein
MSILSTLKLTSARKPRALPDVVKRRNKLLQKLSEQRELALAQSEGRMYAPKRLRTVRDLETGQRMVREIPIRIKAWWWTGEKNEILLSVFYGSRALEFAKGKTAIEILDVKQLVPVIDTVITAAKTAELDVMIEAASVKLRDGFKK